jgi:hypothetical protein
MDEEVRQVVDIEFMRVVTEYRAQILENELGQRFVAPFPQNVNSRFQYGNGQKLMRFTCPNINYCLMSAFVSISLTSLIYL